MAEDVASTKRHKQQLRRSIEERRARLDDAVKEQKDDRIVAHLLSFYDGGNFDCLFGFMSVRNEPAILPRIAKLRPQLKIFAPVVATDFAMNFHQLIPGEKLVANKFGIMEPSVANPVREADAKCFIAVPSLAISKTGVRLGFGGGYYDRYFARFPSGCKIAVTYSEFVMDLDKEPHDIRLDGYCTDQAIVLLTS